MRRNTSLCWHSDTSKALLCNGLAIDGVEQYIHAVAEIHWCVFTDVYIQSTNAYQMRVRHVFMNLFIYLTISIIENVFEGRRWSLINYNNLCVVYQQIYKRKKGTSHSHGLHEYCDRNERNEGRRTAYIYIFND